MKKSHLLSALVVGAATFAAGFATAAFTRSQLLTDLLDQLAADPVAGASADAAGDAAPDHLALTETAIQNLGLRLGPVQLAEYFQFLRVPGEVVEKAGFSSRTVTAPVIGTVTQVLITQGQAVAPGDQLFEVRVTDQALIDAQLAMLNELTQLDVVQTELNRLEPLIQAGTLPGRKRIDLQYEQQKLEGSISTRRQELLVRGLTAQQVQAIADSKQLIRQLTVELDEHAKPATSSMSVAWPAEASAVDAPVYYIVQEVLVSPGQTVQRGEQMCSLASHGELYIRGHAFENEVEDIASVSQHGWSITAEFGFAEEAIVRPELSVEYVDNHVDENSQTFPFFVPIENEIMHQRVNERDQRFVTWRFKPGQRVQLRVPIHHWEAQMVVPAAAVVQEGAEAYVFRKIADTHTHTDSGQSIAMIEVEPVPVTIIFRDDRQAVLDPGGSLKLGDVIAMNQAYQLNLALKQAAGGGGAHHHGHEH